MRMQMLSTGVSDVRRVCLRQLEFLFQLFALGFRIGTTPSTAQTIHPLNRAIFQLERPKLKQVKFNLSANRSAFTLPNLHNLTHANECAPNLDIVCSWLLPSYRRSILHLVEEQTNFDFSSGRSRWIVVCTPALTLKLEPVKRTDNRPRKQTEQTVRTRTGWAVLWKRTTIMQKSNKTFWFASVFGLGIRI